MGIGARPVMARGRPAFPFWERTAIDLVRGVTPASQYAGLSTRMSSRRLAGNPTKPRRQAGELTYGKPWAQRRVR